MSQHLVRRIDESAQRGVAAAGELEDFSGRVLHVCGNTGDDANDGSPAGPLKTIQRAVDLAVPGDCVTVLAQRGDGDGGDVAYTGNVVIAGKPGLSLRGVNPYRDDAGGCGPYLRTRVRNKPCLTVAADSPKVRLMGLGVEGGEAPAVAIEASGVVIDDVTIDGNGPASLLVRASGAVIQRCHLSGGVLLNGAHHTVTETFFDTCILTGAVTAIGDVDNVYLSSCNFLYDLPSFLDFSAAKERSSGAVNGCRFGTAGLSGSAIRLPDGSTWYFDGNLNAVGDPLSL